MDHYGSIKLPVIRLDSFIDDASARVAAHAGLLHHVIVLGDTYVEYFDQLSKRVRQKCRQAARNISFSEHHSIPTCDLWGIQQILVREHSRLASPCPPLRYIQHLLCCGLVTLCIAKDAQGIVGFFIYSSENGVFHVKWMVMDNTCSSSYTSIGLWSRVIKLAFNTDQRILSLGSTSQWGLSLFKEQLAAKRALLETCTMSVDGSVHLSSPSIASVYCRLLFRLALRILTRLVVATKNQSLYTLFSDFCWRCANG
jgi:hypothetical protein